MIPPRSGWWGGRRCRGGGRPAWRLPLPPPPHRLFLEELSPDAGGGPAGGGGTPTAAAAGDAAAAAAGDGGGDGAGAHLGAVAVSIVGMRYYGGVVHRGEWVELVREPANPYDANAIRVENMARVQVCWTVWGGGRGWWREVDASV